MAYATPQATAASILPLILKLKEDDPDLRYMALNDLSEVLANSPTQSFTASDFHVTTQLVGAIVKALEDTNGDVQNMALRLIPTFVVKAPEAVISSLIENIAALKSENAVDASLPAVALRSIVVSIPGPLPGATKTRAVQMSYSSISRSLIPRLIGYAVVPHGVSLPKLPAGLLQSDMERGTDTNAIDVLNEVARCFGSMLQEAEVNALSNIALDMSQNRGSNSVVKKKAVAAIAHLAPYWGKGMLTKFVDNLQAMLAEDLTKTQRKLIFNLLASTVRAIPQKIESRLPGLIPSILESLTQDEADADISRFEETAERDQAAEELREAALMALESALVSCVDAMRPFTQPVIEIIQRFLKYDPNLADNEDLEDMEENDVELDEDDEFEQDDAGDDEEDSSWKVRKSAAKVANAVISTRSNGDLLEDGSLYHQIAPALFSRFQEREETVRLEVLQALSLLIRITGGEPAEEASLVPASPTLMGPPLSRKRRRGGSDASMLDSAFSASVFNTQTNFLPSSTAFSDLEVMGPQIFQGLAVLMQNNSLPTKQGAIGTLKDLVIALHGKLQNYLSKSIPVALDTISKSFTSSTLTNASVTTVTECRIESLAFLGVVAEVQSSRDIQPYAASIVRSLVGAMRQRFAKISTAALQCIGHYIDALTPPRTADAQFQGPIVDICTGVLDVISATELDLDVRRLAIHSLGMLLGRSAQVQGLLPKAQRTAGMNEILQRLRNETTRLAAVRAVETIATFAKDTTDYPADWVPQVSSELVEQFRKASRSLRGSSLSAMKALAINSASVAQFNSEAISLFVPSIEPVISSKDLHTATPALLILASFVKQDPSNDKLQGILDPVCELLSLSMPKGTLDALIHLVRAYGENGAGKELMTKLLRKYSLQSSPTVAGKVIGNLLATGSGSFGNITVESFVKEVALTDDQQRKCLALCILGEVAGLEGAECNLTPKFFIDRFEESDENTATAAATALGRAGVGNIPVYLPVILAALEEQSLSVRRRQLLLHTILEIVSVDDPSELATQVQALWNHVMSTAQAEENRSVGSECLGRLALLDPGTFFLQLRALLEDPNSSISLRGLALSALRAAITSESPAAHTATMTTVLRAPYHTILGTIPSEPDLENRKLGLTIISAALHSRLEELVMPFIKDTIRVILHEMQIRKELIKEVTMGPFKHKVDEGLDTRKAAYECVYTLFSNPSIPPQIIAAQFTALHGALSDDAEIRQLTLLTLQKAVEIYPDTTFQYLSGFVDQFRKIVDAKPKENAVKQEIERMEESKRGVLRLAVDAIKKYPTGISSEWAEWWQQVGNEHGYILKEVTEGKGLGGEAAVQSQPAARRRR